MTEAEILELIAIYASNAINSFAVFASITFAFLAVSYITGSALTRFQAYAISVLYVIAAGSAVSSTVGNVQAWGKLVAKNPPTLAELVVYRADFWDLYLAILGVGVVLVNLYFLYDVRRTAAKKAVETSNDRI